MRQLLGGGGNASADAIDLEASIQAAERVGGKTRAQHHVFAHVALRQLVAPKTQRGLQISRGAISRPRLFPLARYAG